jgi:ribosomal protein S21
LNRVLNENQVRRELKRQERFESPSNKRVRLGSERHRRRFKVAVGKAVSLAMRMKDL